MNGLIREYIDDVDSEMSAGVVNAAVSQDESDSETSRVAEDEQQDSRGYGGILDQHREKSEWKEDN